MELLHNEILHCTFDGIADNKKKTKKQNTIYQTIYYTSGFCSGSDVFWWFGWQREGCGCTFSLQQVRESIKEEIDMTANAVTHQTLVSACGCVQMWQWGKTGSRMVI